LPGLTGLWQVAVRSDGDNRDKPDYDTAYVKNWSLWDDIDILYRTIDVVLTGHGAV
jgi:lipopolysaccharide/colanic/teichoic acid biosynthesis glycosyltransferase